MTGGCIELVASGGLPVSGNVEQVVSTNGYLWTQVTTYSRLGAFSACLGDLTQTAILPQHISPWPLAPL